jgi:hypothetical protein
MVTVDATRPVTGARAALVTGQSVSQRNSESGAFNSLRVPRAQHRDAIQTNHAIAEMTASCAKKQRAFSVTQARRRPGSA